MSALKTLSPEEIARTLYDSRDPLSTKQISGKSATEVVSLLLSLCATQYPSVPRNVRGDAVKALAKVDPTGYRTLVALLDVLPSVSSKSQDAAAVAWDDEILHAITTSLWVMPDELALVVHGERRERLREAVRRLWENKAELTNPQTDFCAAVIKALTIIGDTQSLGVLETIAFDKSVPSNRDFLRALAADCILLLKAEAEKNQKTSDALPALLKNEHEDQP